MSVEAAVILVALVGVFLVGAFSFTAGRDGVGNLALGRWLNLDRRLGWARGDQVATWATRLGWALIGIAGLVQFFRALDPSEVDGSMVTAEVIQIASIVVTAVATAFLAVYGFAQLRANRRQDQSRSSHLTAQSGYHANLVDRSLTEAIKDLGDLRGHANMTWWQKETSRIADVLRIVETNVQQMAVYATQHGSDPGAAVSTFFDGAHQVNELAHDAWGEPPDERDARADKAIALFEECRSKL